MTARDTLTSPLYMFSNQTLIVEADPSSLSSGSLHQSILDGRLRQVRYLLQFGTKVNMKDVFGRTCLMLASLSNHEEYGCKLAKLLIKHGADLNIQDYMGRTAVFLACSEQREKLFKYFIEEETVSVDFRVKDNDGNSLINYAGMFATPPMVSSIVHKMSEMRISCDQRNALGYTAFLLAIRNKKYDNAYILLTQGGASPFLKDNEYFFNGLEWIVKTLSEIELAKQVKRSSNHTPSNHNVSRSTRKPDTSSSHFESSSLNDFQRDFTKQKSLTGISLTGHSKTPVNYKTWYGVPSQYESITNPTSKCEHLILPNYSTDCRTARYTPAIFTPRPPPLTPAKTPRRSRSYGAGMSYQDSILVKLIEKIHEKMLGNGHNGATGVANMSSKGGVNSNTTATDSMCSSAAAMQMRSSEEFGMATTVPVTVAPQPTHSHDVPQQLVDRTLRFATTSARSLTSSVSVSQPQTANQPFRNNQRLIQQQNNPLYAALAQANVTLPSLPSTAKLVALQPPSRSSVKADLHRIFECYNGTNAYRGRTERQIQTPNHSPSPTHPTSHKKPNRSIIQKEKMAAAMHAHHAQEAKDSQRIKEVTFNLDQ